MKILLKECLAKNDLRYQRNLDAIVWLLFQAISLLQRKIAETEAEKVSLKRQIEQKDEILSYSNNQTRNLDKSYHDELAKCRKELRTLGRGLELSF